MNGRASCPVDSEHLNFLQTLINEESGQEQGRPDSDKENEAGLSFITEGQSTVHSAEHFSIRKMMQVSDGQEKNIGMTKGDHQKTEADNVWDDFISEDDFKKEQEKKGINDYSNDEFESLEPVEREDDVNRLQATGKEEAMNRATLKKLMKKSKKRLFKHVKQPRLAVDAVTGGSHPNLVHHENEQQDHHCNQLETMSETRRRRLSKKKQTTCNPGTEHTGDRLQQKYQELHTLLMTPAIDPGYKFQHTRNQLRRLQCMSQQYSAHTMNMLPNGHSKTGQAQLPYDEFHQESTSNMDSGYTTLRTIQITSHATSRSQTALNRHCVPTEHSEPRRSLISGKAVSRGRVATRTCNNGGTANPCKATRRSRENSSEQSYSSSVRNYGGSDTKDTSEQSYSRSVRNCAGSDTNEEDRKRLNESTDDENKSKSDSHSPARTLQYLDTHLKNNNNPVLRQWLRRKNKELRKQKMQERKKSQEERARKQAEHLQRQNLFKDSEEKVKEWLKKKSKEAWKKAREERKIKREEEERDQHQLQYSPVFRVTSLDRSLSAQPHEDKKMFIPINRPGTDRGGKRTEREALKENLTSENISFQPPPTKFVLKHPMSGQVRLIKLQQERKKETKRSELEKRLFEQHLAEEKSKKMRMSYDQWLLKKRETEYVKQKEATRQKALTKSDPELEKIIPDLARRRIENIQRGKKRIDSGMHKINDEVNKSFGGGDFGTENEEERAPMQPRYRLEVSGSQKSLKERPSSAKSPLIPSISKSPSKPKSAHPRVQALLEADQNTSSSESYPFKLPFPPEKGVPRHIAARQKKLFAPQVFESSDRINLMNTEPLNSSADLVQPVSLITSEKKEMESVSHVDLLAEKKDIVQNTEQSSAAPEISKYGVVDNSFFVTDGNLGESKQDQENAETSSHFQDIQTDTSEPEVEEHIEILSDQDGELEQEEEISHTTKLSSERLEQDREISHTTKIFTGVSANEEDLSLNLESKEEENTNEIHVNKVNSEELGTERSEHRENLTKHVSFQEKTLVYETLSTPEQLFGINDDDFTNDGNNDEVTDGDNDVNNDGNNDEVTDVDNDVNN